MICAKSKLKAAASLGLLFLLVLAVTSEEVIQDSEADEPTGADTALLRNFFNVNLNRNALVQPHHKRPQARPPPQGPPLAKRVQHTQSTQKLRLRNLFRALSNPLARKLLFTCF